MVLLTQDNPDHDLYRNTFRKYAVDHMDIDGRVRYAYVYVDTQTQFVNKLTKGQDIANDTHLKVSVKQFENW